MLEKCYCTVRLSLPSYKSNELPFNRPLLLSYPPTPHKRRIVEHPRHERVRHPATKSTIAATDDAQVHREISNLQKKLPGRQEKTVHIHNSDRPTHPHTNRTRGFPHSYVVQLGTAHRLGTSLFFRIAPMRSALSLRSRCLAALQSPASRRPKKIRIISCLNRTVIFYSLRPNFS